MTDTSPLPIGTRVRITNKRTYVGFDFVGRTATVTGHTSPGGSHEHLLTFDGEVREMGGPWSHDALDRIDPAPTTALAVGTRIIVLDTPNTARAYVGRLGMISEVESYDDNSGEGYYLLELDDSDDLDAGNGGSWPFDSVGLDSRDDVPVKAVKVDEITATLADGTVVKVGDSVTVDSSQFNFEPMGFNHGETVVVTSISVRHLGSDGWLINEAGFEWFTGVKVDTVESRPIDAQAEIDALKVSLDASRHAVTTLTQAASDERRRLCSQIDDNHAQAVAEGAEMKAKLDAANAKVVDLIVEKTDLEAEVAKDDVALRFTQGMLSDSDLDRLDAYMIGYRDGLNKNA